MSPQFVDFDADGHLDMVAGTFDGSPHLARGSAAGWLQPEQILDRKGDRIVLNAFWNFDTKKWDATKQYDAEGHSGGEGHCTSAWAVDQDGDGDLDLLLGDHRSGFLCLRRNEGKPGAPAFALVNEPVLASGKPLQLPGTITTMRLVDWDRDGRDDLLLGSMGDPYQQGPGGGVYLFLNRGKTTPVYGEPLVLVPPSPKGGSAPTRPDAGLYMDVADVDGDGDLDLVAGGYSLWEPPAPELTDEQQARVAELQQQRQELDQKMTALGKAMIEATKGLEGEAATAKRSEVLQQQAPERQELGKQRQAIQRELDPLLPGAKREAFVWLYENVSPPAQPDR